MAYIPETVMNCDDDYVNKAEKYKCLENTIDGNIFNKHNDQGKKDMKKKLVFHPVSQPRQINSIFTVNRPILYIYLQNKFEKIESLMHSLV